MSIAVSKSWNSRSATPSPPQSSAGQLPVATTAQQQPAPYINKDWMPAYAAHVQKQDEQWGLSQFTNRSINTRLGPTDKKKNYPGYFATELILKVELPQNGDASQKLQAA